MGILKKIKKAASKAISSVAKTATSNNNVFGQVAGTLSGGVTGGTVTTNKTGLIQGGNAAQSFSGGMASSRDLTADKAKNLVTSQLGTGAKAPEAGVENPGAVPPPPPDPFLEEELANARKRGRASTVLAGLNDTGASSSRKSLLGV